MTATITSRWGNFSPQGTNDELAQLKDFARTYFKETDPLMFGFLNRNAVTDCSLCNIARLAFDPRSRILLDEKGNIRLN
jgi:hypothetical protein